jgi:hypothetical protein
VTITPSYSIPDAHPTTPPPPCASPREKGECFVEKGLQERKEKKLLFSSVIYNPRGLIVSFFLTQTFELLIIKVTGPGSNRLSMVMLSN